MLHRGHGDGVARAHDPLGDGWRSELEGTDHRNPPQHHCAHDRWFRATRTEGLPSVRRAPHLRGRDAHDRMCVGGARGARVRGARIRHDLVSIGHRPRGRDGCDHRPEAPLFPRVPRWGRDVGFVCEAILHLRLRLGGGGAHRGRAHCTIRTRLAACRECSALPAPRLHRWALFDGRRAEARRTRPPHEGGSSRMRPRPPRDSRRHACRILRHPPRGPDELDGRAPRRFARELPCGRCGPSHGGNRVGSSRHAGGGQPHGEANDAHRGSDARLWAVRRSSHRACRVVDGVHRCY